jgi:hypothetical protein
MFALTCALLLSLQASGPRGQLLVLPGDSAARMAIGLDETGNGGPEAIARAYLSRNAGTFGLREEDHLALLSSTPELVVFERQRAGVAVMGAEVKATFDARGHLTMVHVGAPVPPTHGAFWVDLDRAQHVATSGVRGGTVLEARAFWRNEGDALRPVYRVRVVQPQPYDVLRAFVDAQTGRLLERYTERQAVLGSVYDVSPVKTPTVVNRTLNNLTGATQLSGTHAAARNCLGNGPGSGCMFTATPNASGDFIFTPDWGMNNTDKFGEVMSYYQIDRFSVWLTTLKSGFVLTPFDAFTNVPTDQEFFLGGSPLGNGHFAIELGQGPTSGVDWSYDADIVWHELGHGVVQQTAQFGFYGKDQYGIYGESGSLNEGSADCLSIGFGDDPVLGDFIGPALENAGLILTPYIRKLDDVITCQGYYFPDGGNGGNPGRFGEIHDDGRILGSFFWALHDRTRALPQNAAEKALLDALSAMNLTASYHEVVLAMQQSMASSFDAGQIVQCLSCEHDIPGCDTRTRRIYAGETHESRLLGSDLTSPEGNGEMPSTFQYELAVPANQVVTIDRFAITFPALPKLYARFNQRVTWSNGSPTYDTVITAQGQTLPAQTAAGTWYLQGAAVDPGSCQSTECTRRFGVRAQVTGGMTRPAPPPQNCQLGSGPGTCTCMPDCTGKVCGSDGCGGSCGGCPSTQACSAAGQCECVPQCAGKACGPDGCGGMCGMCSSGTCNMSTGVCEGCVPQCSGKVCGPNGCGQACGQCATENVVCDVTSGQCVDIGTGGGGGQDDAGTGGGDTGSGGGGQVKGTCGCAQGGAFGGALLLALLIFRKRLRRS